jgi:hypothetical protein
MHKAKKFGALAGNEEDSELDEDNLLETPLDKFEPYVVFRDALLSKSRISGFNIGRCH